MTQGCMSSLLNSLGSNETVVFADPVHPTHAALAVDCLAKAKENLAIKQIRAAFI